VDTYLTLLDAQREQLNAQLQESQLQRQQRVAVVRLYKALGGGWDPVTDSLTLPPPKKAAAAADTAAAKKPAAGDTAAPSKKPAQ
jgi:hypothetical protein